ncbi:hypothetical protein GCM10022215_26370 [Nocardioides fonticola]|uniref:Glycosyltransferase 2-like domain-containing protein n=1 Tax=Nocardioides fonticola TaxID=450363 RepID=A0ABP7XMB4_9ACTN
MNRPSGASASLSPLVLPARDVAPRTPHFSLPTRVVRSTALARRFNRLARSQQTTVEVVLAFVMPPLLGFLVYLPLARWAPAVASTWFWLLFGAMVVTTLMILLEIARAHRFPEPPVGRVADADLPRVATVVAAYLPNEEATLEDALRAHLAMDYPVGRHVVVLAYNTPEPMALEARLADWSMTEGRLLVVKVAGSTSKVENVEAALRLLEGEVDVIGIFDADHHPHPMAARRAAQWIGDAAGERRFDVVQGQCAIRNVEESWVTKLVAAEFATLYAVAHPGRTVVNDFGIFGGSNGWWRAPVLQELRLDRHMLTEDIDVTARALAAGHRLGTDPRILSTELAPVTWSALWRQRMRWSQGWLEVSLRHLPTLMADRRLSAVQRRGIGFLFGWRIVHPWLATQMLPLVAAQVLVGPGPIHPFLPFFLLTGLLINGTPVAQAIAGNRLASPGIAHRPRLFAGFALLSIAFYAEAKMVGNRAALVRHLLGTHTWDVTTRGRDRRPARTIGTAMPAGGPALAMREAS